MYDLVMFLNIMTAVLFIGLGMLIRQILEVWKDWHVEKALYEAQHGVKHYRAKPRHRRSIPKEVLAKFAKALREKKSARMVYDHGRWTNAA